MKNQKAIALILALGILAILSTLSTSFMLAMRLEYKAAINYYNSVQSQYLAEAGVQEAIARLKLDAQTNAFTYTAGASRTLTSPGGTEIGSYSAVVIDEQSKLNIKNAGSEVLEKLISLVLETNDAGTINRIRSALSICSDVKNIYELKTTLKSNNVDESELAVLMPYLTVVSPSCGGSWINVNTAREPVLRAVLEGAGGINESQLGQVLSAIKSAIPITSWSEFNDIFDAPQNGLVAQGVLSSNEADAIKDMCNPNRENVSGTKFSFNSGGNYTIEGTSSLPDSRITDKAVANAYIYDIVYHNTKNDFEQGSFDRASWRNDCPTSFQGSEKIDGSIKLGFYDDFSDPAFTIKYWSGWNITIVGGKLRTNFTSAYPPNSYGDFNVRVEATDFWNSDYGKDVAWLKFRGGLLAIHMRQGYVSWWDEEIKDGNGNIIMWDPVWIYLIEGSITGKTISEYIKYVADTAGKTITTEEAEKLRYKYPPGRLALYHYTDPPDISEHYIEAGTQCGYYNGPKTFRVKAIDYDIEISVDGTSLEKDLTGYPISTSGSFELYSHGVISEWDDFHVMTDHGSYTSKLIAPSGGGPVMWGTITGTLSHSTIDKDLQGSIVLSTSPGTSSASIADGGFAAIGVRSNSLIYTADLHSGDSDLIEAPILEDVTLTYIPKTKLTSFTFE